MALSASMAWEVRSGGSSTNSGGFKAGASGTDRTQQDAAYITFTDLVIDAVDNTKVTSAGNPFDSTSPGNTIRVSGGTGFTTGTYEILSVATGVATLDRAVGTTSSTGGTGTLGGGKVRLEDVDSVIVAGNTVWMLGGLTYTRTTTNTLTADGTAAAPIRVVGYAAGSRTDTALTEASMPIMTSATNSVALLSLNAAPFWSFRNIKFTHTAGTRGAGVVNVTAVTDYGPRFENCVWDGCLSAVVQGSSAGLAYRGAFLFNCTIRNCTSHAINWGGGTSANNQLYCDSCYFHDNAGACVTTTAAALTGFYVARCVFDSSTGASGYGVWVQSTTGGPINATLQIDSCVFWNNAQSGLRFEYTTGRHALVQVTNNIFVSNGAYGVSCATAGVLDSNGGAFARCNAFYGNSTNPRQNFVTGEGDVTMTGTPFNNAASADFTLDNTASEGAAIRAVNFPTSVGAVGATAGTNYGDIGALQAQATAGGGTVAYGFAG